VILLSTRERILTIRLLEKVKKHASYANALGIEAVKEKLWIPNKTDPKASGVDRK
jgi:hypothetical protein